MYEAFEKTSLAITQPKEGDFVQYVGESFARISRIHPGGHFQISNKIGVFIYEDGATMASGCTWDPDITLSENLFLDRLVSTEETKKGRCWTLDSQNKAIYFEIDCKIWRLKQEEVS